MERNPILSEPAAIKVVHSPLSVEEMLPKYRYQLQSGVISDESNQMFSEFVEFLKTNEELVTDINGSNREDFVKGFQKAVAFVRLWIDSIYLEKESPNK